MTSASAIPRRYILRIKNETHIKIIPKMKMAKAILFIFLDLNFGKRNEQLL
jgi:hypothetical protein